MRGQRLRRMRVRVFEEDAVSREPVDVRRRDLRVPVEWETVGAERVDRNEHHRTAARLRGTGDRVIEHHVDDDAGDRHVEPDRQRPSREAGVAVVACAQPADQRDERQRRHERGKGDVRDQDEEVEGADRPLPRKRLRPGVGVVDDIADEKERRGGEGRDHDAAVLLDAPAPDQHVADHEQDGSDRVERGVYGRKVVDGQGPGVTSVPRSSAATGSADRGSTRRTRAVRRRRCASWRTAA